MQTDVFMAAGKTYDVMINVPTAGSAALPVYDRELSLSGNSVNRDSGMLAYIGVNGSGLPTAGSLGAAVARADTYNSLISGQTFTVSDPSKGVIANDTNVFGVQLDVASVAVTGGTVTLNAERNVRTFQPWPRHPRICSAILRQTARPQRASSGITAMVHLGGLRSNGATVETASNIAAYARIYNRLQVYRKPRVRLSLSRRPGVLGTAYDTSGLPADTDAAGYPLSVLPGSAACSGGTVVLDSEGGFTATVTGSGAVSCSFTYQAKNTQGVLSAATNVTVNFPAASGLTVTVLDGYDKSTTITDYRWIIEEDKTFLHRSQRRLISNPTTGTTVVPTLGVNFHTSYMPFIAQGCTGALVLRGWANGAGQQSRVRYVRATHPRRMRHGRRRLPARSDWWTRLRGDVAGLRAPGSDQALLHLGPPRRRGQPISWRHVVHRTSKLHHHSQRNQRGDDWKYCWIHRLRPRHGRHRNRCWTDFSYHPDPAHAQPASQTLRTRFRG